MPITPFPQAPSRASSPDVFENQVDQFLGHIPTFVVEINQTVNSINGATETAQGASASASEKAGIATAKANEASNAAQSAASSAASAKNSEDGAAASANIATVKSTAASASAMAAAQSATQAQGFASAINPENVNFTGGRINGVIIGGETACPVAATTLSTTGNAGIGTSTPAERLDVNGAIAIGGKKFFSKIGSDSYIWNNTTGLNFVDCTGNTMQMRLDANANLIVGTGPALLSSGNRGNVTVNGQTSGVFALGVGGSASAYLFTDTVNIEFGSATAGQVLKFVQGSEIARFDSNANFLLGTTSGQYHNIQRASATGSGVLLVGSSTSGALSTLFIAVGGSGYSGAAAAQWIGKDMTTGRSVNAGGTVNVTGLDYAEYMRKSLRHAHWIFEKVNRPGTCRRSEALNLGKRRSHEQQALPGRIQDRGGQAGHGARSPGGRGGKPDWRFATQPV